MKKKTYCLADFPERRRHGKEWVTTCPQCGKKKLYIEIKTGLYNCFVCSDMKGKLEDYRKPVESRMSDVYRRIDRDAAYIRELNSEAVKLGKLFDERGHLLTNVGNSGCFNTNSELYSIGNGSANGSGGAMVGDSDGEDAVESVRLYPTDYKAIAPEKMAKLRDITFEPEENSDTLDESSASANDMASASANDMASASANDTPSASANDTASTSANDTPSASANGTPTASTNGTPETSANAEAAQKSSKNTEPQEVAAARFFLESRGISLEVAQAMGVKCCMCRMPNKDGNESKSSAGNTTQYEWQPCIAFVYWYGGKPVMVKLRSCKFLGMDSKGQPRFSKSFFCDNPNGNLPKPPYGIDRFNPDLNTSVPTTMSICEGEMDVLSQLTVGFDGAVSMPNGCAEKPARAFTHILSWLNPVENILLSGDKDRHGRECEARFLQYFRGRCLEVAYPADCKDCNEVLMYHGEEMLTRVLTSAEPYSLGTTVEANDTKEATTEYLIGHRDQGCDFGYGPITHETLRLTQSGGLMIITGLPNAGKTDIWNDMLTHLMVFCNWRVALCSFEMPDKAVHLAKFVQLLHNTTRFTEGFDFERSFDFLQHHLYQIDFTKPMRVNEAMGLPADESSPGTSAFAKRTEDAVRQALAKAQKEQAGAMTPGMQLVNGASGLNTQIEPTVANILTAADELWRRHHINVLTIDPYAYISMPVGGKITETDAIKVMLQQFLEWGRRRSVWVVIIAHPRKLSPGRGPWNGGNGSGGKGHGGKGGGGTDGKFSLSDNMDGIVNSVSTTFHDIAGSAHWANLSDIILSFERVSYNNINYTICDVQKLRNQDICIKKILYFVRSICGRYNERTSPEEVVIEQTTHKYLYYDTRNWLDVADELERKRKSERQKNATEVRSLFDNSCFSEEGFDDNGFLSEKASHGGGDYGSGGSGYDNGGGSASNFDSGGSSAGNFDSGGNVGFFDDINN